MASEKKLKPITLQDLKNYSKGAVVELPPFDAGQPFIARVQRPSIMSMLNDPEGGIPNELLGAANAIFTGEYTKEMLTDPKLYGKVYEVWMHVARQTLVEPTLADLEANGLHLNDQQLTAIFNYSQEGPEAIAQFRTEQADSTDN